LPENVTGWADAGHSESQYDLGILFSTGKGVALDYVTAHKWFNLAAAAGITEAWELGADVASQMSKDDVGEALRAARE
jgi:TPR repeat protein